MLGGLLFFPSFGVPGHPESASRAVSQKSQSQGLLSTSHPRAPLWDSLREACTVFWFGPCPYSSRTDESWATLKTKITSVTPKIDNYELMPSHSCPHCDLLSLRWKETGSTCAGLRESSMGQHQGSGPRRCGGVSVSLMASSQSHPQSCPAPCPHTPTCLSTLCAS